MRTCFNTRYEVAHLWAHQLQPEARYSGSNFYFVGDTIYSYGYHFPLGKVVYNRQGDRAYILNPDKYSATTAKHQGDVYRSLSDSDRIFYNSNCISPYIADKYLGGYDDAIGFVLSKCHKIIEFMNKQRRARVSDYSSSILKLLWEIKSWINFWELDKRQKWSVDSNGTTGKFKPTIFQLFETKDIYTISEKLDYGSEEIECFCEIHKHGLLANRIDSFLITSFIQEWFNETIQTTLTQKREEQLKAHEKLLRREIRTRLQKDRERLEKWHNNEAYSFSPSDDFIDKCKWHTALRINKKQDCIETSKKIFISFEEAHRLWKLVARFEKTGRFTHQLAIDINGCQWKFNGYKNHILTAGCHKIPFCECERIAKLMGW